MLTASFRITPKHLQLYLQLLPQLKPLALLPMKWPKLLLLLVLLPQLPQPHLLLLTPLLLKLTILGLEKMLRLPEPLL
jgi:hypothetical protein